MPGIRLDVMPLALDFHFRYQNGFFSPEKLSIDPIRPGRTVRLLWSDEKIIGGKTGYTRKAGHCFVCAAQGETKTILVAILGSPSRKNLWRETEKLVSRNFQGASP
jgi:D-alanyl-D-alanine carboxypeptidase